MMRREGRGRPRLETDPTLGNAGASPRPPVGTDLARYRLMTTTLFPCTAFAQRTRFPRMQINRPTTTFSAPFASRLRQRWPTRTPRRPRLPVLYRPPPLPQRTLPSPSLPPCPLLPQSDKISLMRSSLSKRTEILLLHWPRVSPSPLIQTHLPQRRRLPSDRTRPGRHGRTPSTTTTKAPIHLGREAASVRPQWFPTSEH